MAGKKYSSLPGLKRIINPFFRRPYNEVTSIPIQASLTFPDSVPLPRRVIERILAGVDEKFIMRECICRGHNRVKSPPPDIGCIVLGPAVRRIHPSNGSMATTEQAIAHVRRAAETGLIANIAHVWIDPLAYWTSFNNLLFICLCDDTNCLYRTYMKRRGQNLDGAYKKLEGIHIAVDHSLCSGCGLCADKCFINAIEIKDGFAHIGDCCKGCGRCADLCPEKAVSITLDNEETLYRQVISRINEMCSLKITNQGLRR